jgi:hypothetical protein
MVDIPCNSTPKLNDGTGDAGERPSPVDMEEVGGGTDIGDGI